MFNSLIESLAKKSTLVAEQTRHIEQLTQSKDEQAQLVANYQKQIQVLQQDNSDWSCLFSPVAYGSSCGCGPLYSRIDGDAHTAASGYNALRFIECAWRWVLNLGVNQRTREVHDG